MNFGRRPNRGGGKFNKSHGGTGGGSRKASGKAWDDGDDFSFAQKPTVPMRTRSRGKGKSGIGTSARSGPGTRFGVGSRGGTRTGVGGAAGTGCRKFADERMKDESEFNLFGNMLKSQSSKSNSQRGERLGSKSSDQGVLLQTINMTAENQKDVKQLLRELQNYEKEVAVQSDNSEEECDPKEEYDELDYRDEDQYWSTKEEGLAVAESVPLVHYPVKQQASFEQSEISPFAVRKLTRYGFHAEYCKSALKMFDGDAGTSLEYLLQLCFREKFKDRIKASPRSGNIILEDCVERRQEEALVLSSIFESKFSERIQNRVWTIELALVFLTQGLNKFRRSETEDVTIRTLKDVCQYYLKGGCRFGSRCKFRHELPSKGEKKEDNHLRCDSNALLYTLEIRFPPNNKYPYEAPLLAFSTTNDCLPQACRLHITEHLYGEALLAAKTHEPVVHTLIMCLENEAKMNELLLETSHKYSVPPVPLSLLTEQTNGEQTPRKYPLDQQLAVKAYTGAELEDDDLQEEEPEAVVMETESYVYLKKKQLKKYNWKLGNVYRENQKLCKQFQAKQSSRQYQTMLQERKKLPAFRERETILNLLNKAQVLVVSGMTGCGKTTQIPQIILDDSLNGPPAMVANIICTQPRRISAISVAERVAKERIERLGGSVGYQIRLESVKVVIWLHLALFCDFVLLFQANSNAENMKLISAILCAALYPNVVQVTTPQSKYAKTMSGTLKVLPKPEELHFITKNDGNVHIHPSSVNYQVRHFESPYLVYHEKVKTSRVFLRDCSMVSVYPLVLFGGGQVSVELERGQFIICLDDGWIRFAAASPQIAELVKELRWELDQLLEDKIKKPNMDLCTCPRGSLIIDMIVKLITTQ
ncbi:putative ATP-dependent RNA helicase DHX57 [Rhincodon typus]|uniref:putative ATP-dependent RNA helicase DHX57 n=1 Tax=Rhincodon typus TaxID=259920 RepID=UPI00202E6C99|nr:putative ATP-dependent RNA helicase DHX57 [Rhincodon typus]